MIKRHVTLERESGPEQFWWNLPVPDCPDCGGHLTWWDCEAAFGCLRCDDCGVSFYVQVTSSDA